METLNSGGITRRSLLSGIAAAPIAATAEAQTRRRPNLLFLFSDQHSYDMMGCSGNKQVHTPVMDQLSSEGSTSVTAFRLRRCAPLIVRCCCRDCILCVAEFSSTT